MRTHRAGPLAHLVNELSPRPIYPRAPALRHRPPAFQHLPHRMPPLPLHPTLDEIAGHGIAFIDLCAEMREIVKSKWRRTDSPPQNLLRCLISSGSDELTLRSIRASVLFSFRWTRRESR